jgi:hypothetical protein
MSETLCSIDILDEILLISRQGRPVNSNREAACFIAKLGGERNSCRNLRKVGEGLSVKYSYIRIILLWHQCSICFMVLGGMDAPVSRITDDSLDQDFFVARQSFNVEEK